MIRAIVLAGGRSRRMGTQKLLLPYGGMTVVARVVDQLTASGVDSVLVVVNAQGAAVAEEALRHGAAVVTNPEDEAPMLSSVRCGLRALGPCEAVLVALGDQPSITSGLVDSMIAALSEAGKGIVVPTYGGKRGHPLLFSAKYTDEILSLYDETGLRGLLDAHPDDVFEMAASTDAVLSDMDCPEDYRREIERLDEGGEA
ncbi:MAG: nucleotidyltransferase family protein [Planctomycetota bacterium]|jgi:molybdenum cofactor cytidylyltransferase